MSLSIHAKWIYSSEKEKEKRRERNTSGKKERKKLSV